MVRWNDKGTILKISFNHKRMMFTIWRHVDNRNSMAAAASQSHISHRITVISVCLYVFSIQEYSHIHAQSGGWGGRDRLSARKMESDGRVQISDIACYVPFALMPTEKLYLFIYFRVKLYSSKLCLWVSRQPFLFPIYFIPAPFILTSHKLLELAEISS